MVCAALLKIVRGELRQRRDFVLMVHIVVVDAKAVEVILELLCQVLKHRV